MPGKSPPPLVQAFVVCREIHEAPETKELTLVAPFSAFTPPQYPAPLRFSIYAHLTEARGRYAMSLQLEDSEGQIVWNGKIPAVEEQNPLRSNRIAKNGIVVQIPGPDRYSLTILANGDELAHHVLIARSPSQN